jgi:hypothetical protein
MFDFKLRKTFKFPKFTLKNYGERDYFCLGWHFRIEWTIWNEDHFCIGFHPTNPIKAILNTKFIE